MDLKIKLEKYLQNFKVLTPAEISKIVDATIIESHKKGTVLLREGQTSSNCYMVVEGVLREYMLVDGAEKSTGFYLEGETRTSYSKEGKDMPSKHYLECMEDCVVTVSNQNFEEDLRILIPRLDSIIQQVAKEKLGQAKEELSTFISSSPMELYLNLLKQRPSLIERVPQHQIASYLGITPESLSRIRKRIQEKKTQV
ncbi:MAG: Crp/Fnr family transcriptional regulator [Saprospiraceae bacterium]|nr:Crp/Fnr family transcriptional regulator [Saprospiraceae bacterium]